MLVVGLQGSPRRRGNTHFLLTALLSEAERLGAMTRLVEVDRMNVVPCKEYVVCEKRGYCPIEDDVNAEIYPLLREADLVVLGTPVFFYNLTAQLKAVIDRCQVFWARKYRFRLRDPKRKTKQGIVLSVAATRGKKLFDAIHLTAKNFFDALDANYADHLTYREIEGPKDMKQHPTVLKDVRKLAEKLIPPYMERRRILFAGRTNAGISQMAAALAEDRYGDRFEVASGGIEPAEILNPAIVDAMADAGLDVAFRKPGSLNTILDGFRPEICAVVDDIAGALPEMPGCGIKSLRFETTSDMNKLRDQVEQSVAAFFEELSR